jgi:probable rRNA maturation factor
MVTLQVKRPARLTVEKSFLIKAAETTLRIISPGREVDVSLILGNDALIKRLNQQYRKVDSTTDVLSFLSGEVDPDSGAEYLGDVIISLPRAKDQANSESHTLADELQLLVVHGVLHLLGYDHQKPADKKLMQAAQDTIMKELGVEIGITL